MKDHSDHSTKTRVSKRHVFFVPGYDPIGPRRYRELYRTHSKQQAEISGYAITMQGRPGGDAYVWDVEACIEEEKVTSTVEVLSWGEIVKSSMNASIPQTYLLMLKTIWIYCSTGALVQLFRLRPTAMIAALYPVAMLILQALLAIAVGLSVAIFLPLSNIVAYGAGLASFGAVLSAFRRFDGPLYAYYLMHDYGFSAQLWGRTPPELEQKLSAFEAHIQAQLNSDSDEVLIVGHSSGAHLAVHLVASLVRQNDLAARKPVLSLLTLGQVIPMISFLPNAGRLRGDLNLISRTQDVAWIDVSAPGDGGSFALCDPVHVTGVAPPEPEKIWPKVLSAKFSKTLMPETLKKTRWRFFRRHIQYLCAFDRPQEYDYFLITAGPQTLKDRFAWRGATKSRKETPLSGFRDY